MKKNNNNNKRKNVLIKSFCTRTVSVSASYSLFQSEKTKARATEAEPSFDFPSQSTVKMFLQSVHENLFFILFFIFNPRLSTRRSALVAVLLFEKGNDTEERKGKGKRGADDAATLFPLFLPSLHSVLVIRHQHIYRFFIPTFIFSFLSS